jgi:nitrate reductase gamma subunit
VKLTKALAAVAFILLFGLVAASESWLRTPVAVVVSYVSVGVFFAGLAYRFALWKKSAVPFRIPVTCGQQASQPWLKRDRLDNPDTAVGAAIRVVAEMLFFRSLLQDHRVEIKEGAIVYVRNRSLWLISIVFHYALMVVLLRHLSLVFDHVPGVLNWLQQADTLLLIRGSAIHVSDLFLVAALIALLLRRLSDDRVRFISLFTDYFALILLFAISVSGILMEYFCKADVDAIRRFAHSLSSFHPAMNAALPPLFLVHRVLVGALLIYFPFSKLLHMGGILANPVYNLANNSRAHRHVNPWDYPVAMCAARQGHQSEIVPPVEPPAEAQSKCPNH